jgi:hypothetical protein
VENPCRPIKNTESMKFGEFLEKQTVHTVKELPAFHGNIKFITAFTIARNRYPNISRIIHSITYPYFVIYILPSTSRSLLFILSKKLFVQIYRPPHVFYMPKYYNQDHFQHFYPTCSLRTPDKCTILDTIYIFYPLIRSPLTQDTL